MTADLFQRIIETESIGETIRRENPNDKNGGDIQESGREIIIPVENGISDELRISLGMDLKDVKIPVIRTFNLNDLLVPDFISHQIFRITSYMNYRLSFFRVYSSIKGLHSFLLRNRQRFDFEKIRKLGICPNIPSVFDAFFKESQEYCDEMMKDNPDRTFDFGDSVKIVSYDLPNIDNTNYKFDNDLVSAVKRSTNIFELYSIGSYFGFQWHESKNDYGHSNYKKFAIVRFPEKEITRELLPEYNKTPGRASFGIFGINAIKYSPINRLHKTLFLEEVLNLINHIKNPGVEEYGKAF